MVAGWREARRELIEGGWTLAARGDWAWVYRSADGARAARVCPYDPAHRLYMRYCERHAGNRFLPTLLRLSDFQGYGT